MRPIAGLHLIVIVSVLILTGCAGDEPPSLVKSERVPVVTQLTDNHDVFEANPIYSPDGEWIAFTSDEAGNDDIFIINIDGTGRRNLTNSPGRDILPNWSPIEG